MDNYKQSIQSIIIHFEKNDDYNQLMKNIQIVLECIDSQNSKLIHLETRTQNLFNSELNSEYDCLLTLEINSKQLEKLKSKLNGSNVVHSVDFVNQQLNQTIWYPKHITDLDQCQHLLLKFQPELQTDHPGFHDENYKSRRAEIARLAFEYCHLDRLPRIEYTTEEIATWSKVYRVMKSAHDQRACREYIEGLKLLEENCDYSPDHIPQLEIVSSYLHRQTGFCLRPVAGLLSPRDFLASLAFRVFQCTQYVRHHSMPLHTPEPDCIHELLGHMPLLTNRQFADFSQELGLASIGASDEDIQKLATLYWFTVEFGLCYENGEIRALGAGLLSSYGELENAFSDKSEKKIFEPTNVAIQIYDDITYQPIYFVTDSIETMKQSLCSYVKTMKKSFVPVYDPITQTIHVKNKNCARKELLNTIQKELKSLEIY